MNKAFALGAVGALALLGVSSAQAQGFGISVGYGAPAYYSDVVDDGWGPRAYREPYSWGGPRHVGSYYAPRTVVTTRRVVSAPVYEEYDVEPRTVVRTRRIVTPVYYAPRRVVRARQVVYRAPAYRPARVVTTRRVVEEPFYGERRVVTRTIQY